MKLFEIETKEDFGKEWTLYLLSFSKVTFVKASFLYNDYSDTFSFLFYFNMTNSLISFAINIWKYSLTIDFLEKNYPVE